MTGYEEKNLIKLADMSPSVMTRMAKDEYVSMAAIVRICVALYVDMGDVTEIIHPISVDKRQEFRKRVGIYGKQYFE